MTQPGLNKNVAMTHVVNLMSIGYRDGQITQEENNLLIEIAQSLGLTEEEFDQCLEYWKHTDEDEIPIAMPASDDDKIAFMRNLFRMTVVDGEIDPGERHYLVSVAEKYGYNGEEVFDYFLEGLTDETEEEKDWTSQVDYGKNCLKWKEVGNAFEQLFEPALDQPKYYTYLQAVVGVDTRLFLLTDEQLRWVEEQAKEGVMVAQYVLGRYHFVVKPDDDSVSKAAFWFGEAAKEGMGDAIFELALMHLYGYYGPDGIEQFSDLLNAAREKSSIMAMKWRLRALIDGTYGMPMRPQGVIDIIEENFFNETEEDYDVDEPVKYAEFYAILGDAYLKLGNKAKAIALYETAEENGYFEAEYAKHKCVLSGMVDIQREMYEMVVDFCCESKVPGGYSLKAQLLEEKYDSKDTPEAEKAGISAQIKEAYLADYDLGHAEAASLLGKNYYYGEHGFEEDDDESLTWFLKGARREDAQSFLMLANLLEEGHGAEEYSEELLERYLLDAKQRLGYDPSKGKRVDAKYLAVIKSDGSADIHVCTANEWPQASALVYAQRLAPIRMDGLARLSEAHGLAGRLTLWTNHLAPRKAMAQNEVASRLSASYVAGDVILTMEDEEYNPMLFLDLDELQQLLETLGAKVNEEVVTDAIPQKRQVREPIDYTELNLLGPGYIARIEPDGKAYILNSTSDGLVMLEEDIYDPLRLDSLHELGQKLALPGRLTAWFDNTALRKQQVYLNTIDDNPLGSSIYQGKVADNFFIAMEDDRFLPMPFKDESSLKQVLEALGIAPEHVILP